MTALSDYNFFRNKEQHNDSAVSYRCSAKEHDIIVWALSSKLELDKDRPISDFQDGCFNICLVEKDKEKLLYNPASLLRSKYNINNYICNCNVDLLLKILDAIGADSKIRTFGNICAKCGMRDEYASYCDRYKEVRCYLHCC